MLEMSKLTLNETKYMLWTFKLIVNSYVLLHILLRYQNYTPIESDNDNASTITNLLTLQEKLYAMTVGTTTSILAKIQIT